MSRIAINGVSYRRGPDGKYVLEGIIRFRRENPWNIREQDRLRNLARVTEFSCAVMSRRFKQKRQLAVTRRLNYRRRRIQRKREDQDEDQEESASSYSAEEHVPPQEEEVSGSNQQYLNCYADQRKDQNENTPTLLENFEATGTGPKVIVELIGQSPLRYFPE